MDRVQGVLVAGMLVVLGLGSCARYNEDGGTECKTLADCNPGRDCGALTACVEGRCDKDKTIDVPCEKVCGSDGDCPADTHCRFGGQGSGTCVADGSCAAASECLGLPHDDCLGSFVCLDGRCRFECLAIHGCREGSECVLADKGCCCGPGPDSYVAVRKDGLADWQNRSECRGVACPEIACLQPGGLSAACEQGQCVVKYAPEEFGCFDDDECVKVPGDCCACDNGGPEAAVNVNFREAYLQDLVNRCADAGMCAPQPNACTNRLAICVKGHCIVDGEDCGCPAEWNPVCVPPTVPGGEWTTFPNPCQVVACRGRSWDYHGRCDCRIECFVADPVCAQNGVTYTCGEVEVACNGQSVRYPGECAPRCDICDQLERPSIPVCGADFKNYNDSCYADCHDLTWWHTGSCLEGEGASCGGLLATECKSKELYCLYENPGCLSCPGVCIALGHCLEPADCDGQPLDSPPCVGRWACTEHACQWICPAGP